MKIAIFINTSWNIYNFRRGLVDFFLGRGDQVIALGPRDDYSEKLVALGCDYYDIPVAASGMNPANDLLIAWRLYKILKREKPDVILTYTIKPNIYASLVAGALKIPCICNVSGLGTVFLWTGTVKKIATAMYAFAFRFSSWIFFQNAQDRLDFSAVVPIDLEKTSLLPGSGVNLKQFELTPPDLGGRTVFLMISRLLIEKGVYDYIEAIRILKLRGVDATFQLIGGLDEHHSRSISRQHLQDWIEEGLIDYWEHQEDVRPYIKRAEVVVLPSYREGTPRTLLEAGAMGRTLLATDVPGCREVVRDGINGFLFRKTDPKDLASKMELYLALSVGERMEMAMNSHQFIAERFGEERVIDAYAQKIDELLAQKTK